MKISDFPYYRPSFAAYNEAQSLVVPFLDKDMNLVVSFPTAAGKTVLFEASAAYHLSTDSECSVCYVCPNRSLAEERVRDCLGNPQLAKYGIAEETSDSDTRMSDNSSARLVIATIEAFDAKTRSVRWQSWLKRIRCLTIDEAHMIGDERRGSALEAAIMRFTALNAQSRVLLLSATMSNALELAKWVKSLNQKQTKSIVSDWRPTKIITKYHVVDDAIGREKKAVELAVKSKDLKTLVFVHSKRVGKDLTKKIREAGARAVFHCASVSFKNREKMERAFDSRTSGLNVLISTSTLAAGINIAK